jgi:amino acid adenylation domain-containing protein
MTYAGPTLEPRQAALRTYERDATIAELFAAQAARTPAAVAVCSDRASLTFAELDRRSNRLANYLRLRGVVEKSTVGVAFERSIELPVALLGILRAGAAYVPLDTSYPPERFAFMIADSGMTAVVTENPICDEALYDGLAVVSVIDDATAIAAQSPTAPGVSCSASDLAYIAYTSGSTGRPKGVAVPGRGVVRLVRNVDYVDISAHDTFLHFAPLAFDASTFEVWAPLLNGARLAIPRPGLLSIADLGSSIEQLGVTTMFLTTSLFERLTDSGLPSFDGLRHLLTGGEVASPAHMRRFLERYPRCRLSAVYGPTENTTFSTWCDLPTAASIGDNVPIGQPIAHSTAYVVDERMERVPDGVAGELCVGGDGVARGYLNLDAITAERFVCDPFSDVPGARLYRTGDRARFRADGLLEFLGRSDDQVKIAGHRIELGEIDVALRAHPSLSDAAVVMCELGGEKALCAFVVPAAGCRFEEAPVREFLAQKLPRFMLPHRMCALEALPEHASGKLDRTALARLAAALDAKAPAATPGGNPKVRRRVALQRTIADCWLELLGGDSEPDADTNFFDAGGDSLRLLTLHDRLQSILNVEFALVDMFDHTTIRKQTAFLAGLGA